jgi:transcriptional regulator with XRE-family HTH domain
MAIASTDVTTGLDLKLLRIERGVTQTALARQMGVWRQTVSVIEAALRPGPDRTKRYLEALKDLTPGTERIVAESVKVPPRPSRARYR